MSPIEKIESPKTRWNRKYRQSDKGKANQKRYLQSEKGKISSNTKYRNYRNTEKGRLRYEKYNEKLKEKFALEKTLVLEKLGGKCNHCGYREHTEILQIDHINGGGGKELREIGHQGVVKKIINGDIEEYQLLCPNCNWLKKFRNNENVSKRS